MFDEWGLPMMKNEKTGRYLREGKWQIMIHGESYKPIVLRLQKNLQIKFIIELWLHIS